MFEQVFKNIDDVLWKEAGCTTELDYTEQTSWLLFLKYLDGLEQDRADEAALEGKKKRWPTSGRRRTAAGAGGQAVNAGSVDMVRASSRFVTPGVSRERTRRSSYLGFPGSSLSRTTLVI